MKAFHTLWIIAALLFAAAPAMAAVTAFGFTLGETSVDDLDSQAENLGLNRISGGPVFQLPTAGFNVDGLESFKLTFNRDGTLAAIVLTMAKRRFDSIHHYLSKKYAVREKTIPFVGNKYVRYGAPGATIELIAPHMSFQMTLAYVQDHFYQAVKDDARKKEQQKKQHEKSQF